MQPIKIYNGTPGTGPNPWKVIIILEELQVPYENVWISYLDIKSEPYTLLNPNGRFPSMTDPNTNVTLFESGAIIEYIIARYDKQLKLTYSEERLQEKFLVQSWLMFQMSGQGPMFGQKMWFTHFHEEPNLTSAIDRYGNETLRIVGVIESSLRKQREKLQRKSEEDVWLVGDKCTLADLAFVPWNLLLITRIFPEGYDWQGGFPEFWKWHHSVTRRPAVHKAIEKREEAMRTKENSAAQALAKRQ